jgi:Zn-dependent M28 family amino/carboxypeptidase
VQRTTVRLFDGTPIGISNIVGSFGTGNANRILLCAHWDSRPYADRDPDPASRGKAIDGANDGAGSCGVLLEIARQVGLCGPSVGVDILFFDAEDWGEVNGDFAAGHYGTWCMGSDYWAGHPHTENYNAAFGILLDMVSGVDARFYREYFSMEYAPHVVDKVWRAARAAGYGRYFPDVLGGAIEDDHLPVNRRLGIPCIDIIQYDPGSATGFGDFWHTLDDDMEHVSVETMKAVGQTVLQVIYDEE